jgi:predicted transcriptional regulator
MPRKKTPHLDDLEVRRKVWHAISEFPGLYSHELQKVTKVPLEIIEKILDEFEADMLLCLRLEEGMKQYFPFVSMGLKHRKMILLIHQDLPKKVVRFLLKSPNSTMKEIEYYIKCPKSKISPCMDELFRLGIITLSKDTHKCNITVFQIYEPDMIEKMLLVKERSLPVLAPQ